MKKGLKKLATVGTVAIAGGFISLQLLNAATPPDDFTTGAWPFKCNSIAACPGVTCNQPNGFLCIVCEFQLSQMDCTFNLFSTCSAAAPPAPPGQPDEDQDCGDRWRGNCENNSCLFNPALDRIGTCQRKWCT